MDKDDHVETVVLLSKGEIPSKKVKVEFSLEGMDLKGVRDFSISYTLVDEPAKKVDPNVGHALLLYEFGFKNPSFR